MPDDDVSLVVELPVSSEDSVVIPGKICNESSDMIIPDPFEDSNLAIKLILRGAPPTSSHGNQILYV